MNPADLKRWLENHQKAAEREIAERRGKPLPPAEAFAAAMSLLRFDESQNGSPFERFDPVSAREDEMMWDTWAILRRRWSDGRR